MREEIGRAMWCKTVRPKQLLAVSVRETRVDLLKGTEG